MIDPQEKVSVELTVGQLLRLAFRSGSMDAPFRAEDLEAYAGEQRHIECHLNIPDELIGELGSTNATYDALNRAVNTLQRRGAFDPDPVEPVYEVRVDLSEVGAKYVPMRVNPEDFFITIWFGGTPARFASHAEAYCAISNALAISSRPKSYINFQVVEVTP